MKSDNLHIYNVDDTTSVELPFSNSGISAGFPSVADDYIDLSLDLNKELIKNPSSTFFARVSGVSMIDEGIDDGDLLVIDKSIEAYDGCLAVAYVDGEFTLKRFRDMGDYGLLVPANSDYKQIKITEDSDFKIWGVVNYIIKKM
ncbi:MAG: translesion error-prone DNA polymerase V autoproteolytic subunit [Rikenellaceae bacterium]